MKLLTLVFCSVMAFSTHGQIRSMIDAPSVYLTSRDVENALSKEGLGLDFGYGIGTHFFMAKISAGVNATADFNSDKEEIKIEKTILANPFAKFEVGLGKWRSNGQQCAKTNQNAFSLLAKGGLIYNFGKKEADLENGLKEDIKPNFDYFVGAELGMFFIKDMHKNSEYFLNGGYMLKSKTIFAELGIRTFFNTLYSNR